MRSFVFSIFLYACESLILTAESGKKASLLDEMPPKTIEHFVQEPFH